MLCTYPTFLSLFLSAFSLSDLATLTKIAVNQEGKQLDINCALRILQYWLKIVIMWDRIHMMVYDMHGQPQTGANEPTVP